MPTLEDLMEMNKRLLEENQAILRQAGSIAPQSQRPLTQPQQSPQREPNYVPSDLRSEQIKTRHGDRNALAYRIMHTPHIGTAGNLQGEGGLV